MKLSLRLLAASAACAAVVAATGCSLADHGSPQTESSSLSDGPLVALRYAYYTDAGWAIVVDLVSDPQTALVRVAYPSEGSWTDTSAIFLHALPNGHALWYAEGLPVDGPLTFAVHYQTIWSGGSPGSINAWDNNGGRNYTTSTTSYAMGPGIDVAVTGASVSAASAGQTKSVLSASVLVRNIAYSKNVGILFSTDGWKTSGRATATYDHGGGDGGEVWHVTAPFDSAATDIQFAAFAQQNGAEAWDDDFGKNFECTLEAAGGATAWWQCAGDALLRCSPGGCVAYPELLR